MDKFLATVFTLIISIIAAGCGVNPDTSGDRGIPNLPRPIAGERALVTTAGQGLDGLIVAKYASKLNIRNYYRHRAEPVDLQDVNSLIITLGFSPAGLEAAYMDVAKEKQRLKDLVRAAVQAKKPIILIHLGGMGRRSPLNDETAWELAAQASYLVVVKESNQDGFFAKLAREKHLPFTEVASLEGIKVPLNSVFR
ncbi:MAG: DUF6305 family protein [Carboxydocellales bacterium]